MTRLRTVHRCTECGSAAPRWSGRCGPCGAWNSLVEEMEPPAADRAAGALSGPGPTGGRPVPVAEVDLTDWQPRPTGVAELDRVLGGGLVPGSATLLGGEPGIGKSTLLLQALAAAARRGARCLLVTAEESAQQVRLRAERLGALPDELWLVAETSMPAIRAAIAQVAPDVVVVDSVQTVHDPDLGSVPGSVAQVRGCAQRLVGTAKQEGLALVLVGHVTKEGTLAGPRVLEHVVDTVLSFEGDRNHALRLLRAVKHRFGATGELGLFEMTEAGLAGVPDAGRSFLGDRRHGAPGSVVVPAMEGHRPLLVELQALVVRSPLAVPRRSGQGLDAGRVALLAAVLAQRAELSFAGVDVYASAVGGVRVAEPAADLALALALASARTGRAVAPDVVACGEIGLAGEVRLVGHMPRRLAEAARLGFRRAVVPASTPDGGHVLELVRCATVAAALHHLGPAAPPPG